MATYHEEVGPAAEPRLGANDAEQRRRDARVVHPLHLWKRSDELVGNSLGLVPRV
jgi:hypothetical protein